MKTKLEVELISLDLDEKNNNKAVGVVKVTGKERTVVVIENYEKEIKVGISGLDEKTLEELNMEYDTTEIVKKFKQVRKEYQEQKEIDKKIRREKEYEGTPLRQVQKALGSKAYFNHTKEEFLENEHRDLRLIYKKVVSGKEIHIVASYVGYYSSGDYYNRSFAGYRFEIENCGAKYNERSTRRCKKVTSAVKAFDELVEWELAKINAKRLTYQT